MHCSSGLAIPVVTTTPPNTPEPSTEALRRASQSPSVRQHLGNSNTPLSPPPRSKLDSQMKTHSKVSFSLINCRPHDVASTPRFYSTDDGRRPSLWKCRICLECEKANERLLSPCKCRGTVGLVHGDCLRHWIAVSGTEVCEICQCHYSMRPRPADCGLWCEQTCGERTCVADAVCLMFLLPCTATAVFFCGKAANTLLTVDYGVAGDALAMWRAVGLIGLALLLATCLLIWLFCTICHYRRCYSAFQATGSVRWSIHNRNSRRCWRQSSLEPWLTQLQQAQPHVLAV